MSVIDYEVVKEKARYKNKHYELILVKELKNKKQFSRLTKKRKTIFKMWLVRHKI